MREWVGRAGAGFLVHPVRPFALRHTPGFEAEPPFFERNEAPAADDQVIQDIHIQQLAGLDHGAGHGDIVRAWFSHPGRDGYGMTMIAEALRRMASRKTSATRTWAEFKLPW